MRNPGISTLLDAIARQTATDGEQRNDGNTEEMHLQAFQIYQVFPSADISWVFLLDKIRRVVDLHEISKKLQKANC